VTVSSIRTMEDVIADTRSKERVSAVLVVCSILGDRTRHPAQGYLAHDPLIGQKRLPHPRVERDFLEPHEIEALLKAARSFDEDLDDAMTSALAAAREIAHRSSVPAREAGPSLRASGIRPPAPVAPSAVHLLVALLSNRRYAAYRALAQCGADIGRLRSAATRVAFGLVAAPRAARTGGELARSAVKGKGRAVEVPLVPTRLQAPGFRPSGLRAPGSRLQPDKPDAPASPEPPPAPPTIAVPQPEACSSKPEASSVDLDPARFPLLAKQPRQLSGLQGCFDARHVEG